MPSASRPFSHRIVTDLVNRGVIITPIRIVLVAVAMAASVVQASPTDMADASM